MTNTENILQKFELALLKKTSLSLKYGAVKIDLYVGENRGEPFYTVCWYDGPKRQRYGTTRPDSALEKIKSLVGAAEVGREAAKKISYERVQEFVEADSALQGIDLADLVRFYKEHIQTRSATLDEVCALYLESANEKSARYRQTLFHYTKKLKTAFSGMQIASITARMLDEYLVKTFPNPKTRANHRGGVCSLFAFAQRKNFLPPGTTEAKKTERPTTKAVEPAVVSSQDMAKLLNECSDKKLAAFVAICGFAGCRAAETIRLRWKNIQDDAIVLSPEITKTNRRRIAELPENLKAWLAPLRGEPEEFVTYVKVFKVYEKAAALFKSAGVAREQNALRHSFVSYHLERHCDPPRTAKAAGHSLAVLEQNYLKLVSKADAEAWFNIFPPEDKKYVEVVERHPSPNLPGRKTWRQIAAARNATVKMAKQKTNKEKDQKNA